jgi:hypothetical protein
MIAAVALTRAVNLPINDALMTWRAATPPRRDRTRGVANIMAKVPASHVGDADSGPRRMESNSVRRVASEPAPLSIL